MLTEDSFRRRELADLGISAEVQSDGHGVVVTLDRTHFDKLIATARSDGSYDLGYERGYRHGYNDGYNDGKADAAPTKAQAS